MSHPLRTRTFADTQAEDIAWLWPGRIACGKVTIVVADGGVGKSLLTSLLAAGVTRDPSAATPRRGEFST